MTAVAAAGSMSPQVEAAWIALTGVFVGVLLTALGAFAKDYFMLRHYVRRDVAVKYVLQRLQVYENIYAAIDATRYVDSGEHKRLLIHCREQCASNYGHVEDRVRDDLEDLVKNCVAGRPIRDKEREQLMNILRVKMERIKRTMEFSM